MPKIELEYDIIKDRTALDDAARTLVEKAFEAANNLAYAPYSGFRVGAAVLLEDGKIVSGSNQENAATPAGICAERSALSAVSALYPDKKIISIAIAYTKDNINPKMAHTPLSPCGICRQTIAEYTARQEAPISLYLCSAEGQIYHIKNAMDLLPLSFGAAML